MALNYVALEQARAAALVVLARVNAKYAKTGAPAWVTGSTKDTARTWANRELVSAVLVYVAQLGGSSSHTITEFYEILEKAQHTLTPAEYAVVDQFLDQLDVYEGR